MAKGTKSGMKKGNASAQTNTKNHNSAFGYANYAKSNPGVKGK